MNDLFTGKSKEEIAIDRIKTFCPPEGYYVAFSGGKDSTVLLDLVRKEFPNVPAVFSNTGLEYPEIVEFVKKQENVIIVRPKKSFKQVVDEYGYPVISKKVARQIRDLRKPEGVNDNTKKLILTGINKDGNYYPSYKLSKKWEKLIDAPFKISEECCNHLKKEPLKTYQKETDLKPFIGTLACESSFRERNWYINGCNSFKGGLIASAPLSFWTEQDILQYILENKLEISSVYGDIQDKDGKLQCEKLDRTGCMFCMFGVHMEKNDINRFKNLKENYPKLFNYCMDEEGLGCKKVLDYIGIKIE